MAVGVAIQERRSVQWKKPHQVMPDITVLPAHFPIPGAGFLPVNGFVIKAEEPVLVDTMSVNDEAALPWLVSEKRFIRQAIDSGKPVLKQ